MGKYPYIKNSGSLKKFLSDIPSTGVPEKVTQLELASRGFASTNDRPIVSILKFIDFLDESGKPTDNWNQYRDTQRGKAVIASCVKKAYMELFNIYSNAHEKDTEALRNFFSTRIQGGEQVLSQTVTTFKVLCEFGDFKSATVQNEVLRSTPPNMEKISPSNQLGDTSRQLVINLNIQLQLPITDNAEIYDKIFQSMKKNVLGT